MVNNWARAGQVALARAFFVKSNYQQTRGVKVMAKSVSADASLKILKDGNKRFSSDRPVHERQDKERRGELKDGQSPFAIVLSCADSRVVPELIFDTGLGEIFVVRVAGNIANTSSIASIEYAVAHLGTKLIVVLGHESCGAVGAAVANDNNGYNLNHLVCHIKPALSNGSVNTIVKKNAKLTAKELEDRSTIIGKAKGLKIKPAYYELVSGKVKWL